MLKIISLFVITFTYFIIIIMIIPIIMSLAIRLSIWNLVEKIIQIPVFFYALCFYYIGGCRDITTIDILKRHGRL